MNPHTKPDSFNGEPRPVTPTTEPACEICGVGDRLRVTWIMRADHASTVVCEDCVREWYESGLATAGAIRAAVLARRQEPPR